MNTVCPVSTQMRRLDLLDGFVALDGVERLAFGDGRAVGDHPFGQRRLVHREANLRKQNLGRHGISWRRWE
jgi:hypothetical protein